MDSAAKRGALLPFWVLTSFFLAGSQQRAAPGPCRSPGIPEKHGDRSKDPVHSDTAWWKVSHARVMLPHRSGEGGSL